MRTAVRDTSLAMAAGLPDAVNSTPNSSVAVAADSAFGAVTLVAVCDFINLTGSFTTIASIVSSPGSLILRERDSGVNGAEARYQGDTGSAYFASMSNVRSGRRVLAVRISSGHTSIQLKVGANLGNPVAIGPSTGFADRQLALGPVTASKAPIFAAMWKRSLSNGELTAVMQWLQRRYSTAL